MDRFDLYQGAIPAGRHSWFSGPRRRAGQCGKRRATDMVDHVTL